MWASQLRPVTVVSLAVLVSVGMTACGATTLQPPAPQPSPTAQTGSDPTSTSQSSEPSPPARSPATPTSSPPLNVDDDLRSYVITAGSVISVEEVGRSWNISRGTVAVESQGLGQWRVVVNAVVPAEAEHPRTRVRLEATIASNGRVADGVLSATDGPNRRVETESRARDTINTRSYEWSIVGQTGLVGVDAPLDSVDIWTARAVTVNRAEQTANNPMYLRIAGSNQPAS